MLILTDREKALLAHDVLDVLPDTGTILRATASSDGAGGRTLSWTTVATVACRIMEAGGPGKNEVVINDHMLNNQSYIVSFPAGTDVRITDRISTNGLLLSVEGVNAPKSVIVEMMVMATRAAV